MMHYLCADHYASLPGVVEHTKTPAGRTLEALEPETKTCCFCRQPNRTQHNLTSWAVKRAQVSGATTCPAGKS